MERSRTVRAAVATILGIGFALRAHRAFLDVDVPDETFHLLARFRPRDPRALLHAASTIFGLFDLLAAFLAYRITHALGLRAGARLFVLGLLAVGPVAAAFGVSGITSIATALIAAALLHSLKKGRSVTRAALGVAVVLLPWLLHPRATRVARAIGDRMPQLWGVEASSSLRASRSLAALTESLDVVVSSLGIGARGGAILLGATIALTIGAPQRTRVALLRMTPFLFAIAVALVMHASFWHLQISTLAPVALFALSILVGIALDRALRLARSPIALLLALSATCLALRTEPLSSMPRPTPPPHTACTRCGEVAYFHPGLVTAIDADPELVDAMLHGRLLDALQARGVERLEIDPRMLQASFLGPNARDRLLSEPDGALRFAKNDAEKDARIAIDREAVPLSEHLGDGWRTDGEWATSVGKSSDLIAVLPNGRPVIQLELAAVAVDRAGKQPVHVFSDDHEVASLMVDPVPRWYEVPLVGAAGRRRLRLVYGAPREQRETEVGWWRSANGAIGAAIRARRIRHGGSPRLPPEGPGLGDPDGARVLASGWLAVETTSVPAVWASAKESIVVFSVDAPEAKHRLTLEAGPPPPDDRGADQRIFVFVGDTSLGTVTLPKASITVHTLDVPPGALVAGDNRLLLRFERLVTDGAITRAAYVRALSLTTFP